MRHRAKTDQTSSKCLVEAKRNSRPHISFRHDQSPRIPFRMRQKGTVVESVHTSNSRNLSDVSMLTQDQGQSSQQGQDSFRQHCRFCDFVLPCFSCKIDHTERPCAMGKPAEEGCGRRYVMICKHRRSSNSAAKSKMLLQCVCVCVSVCECVSFICWCERSGP